jgi:myosin heavy subunit
MAPVNRLDAVHASAATLAHPNVREFGDADQFEMTDFEAELKRLSAANQELLDEFHPVDAKEEASDDGAELAELRRENADLKARIEELEALVSGQSEELWLERQREYEMLLEEKSEVIRALHQKIHEAQESVNLGAGPPSSLGTSATRLGQAEEIMRLKRELEEQRRQLEQDEEDMMAQMRQMELTMAKERAEMARQRQEVQRQQSDLAREIEQSSRDPELRERLNTLRRQSDPKLKPPTDQPPPPAQKSSGFFRRMFG